MTAPSRPVEAANRAALDAFEAAMVELGEALALAAADERRRDAEVLRLAAPGDPLVQAAP
jgi:hypothetical protein